MEPPKHCDRGEAARPERDQHGGNGEEGGDDDCEPQHCGNQRSGEFDCLRPQAEVGGECAPDERVGDDDFAKQRIDENHREIGSAQHHGDDDEPFGDEAGKADVAGDQRAEDERRRDPADRHEAGRGRPGAGFLRAPQAAQQMNDQHGDGERQERAGGDCERGRRDHLPMHGVEENRDGKRAHRPQQMAIEQARGRVPHGGQAAPRRLRREYAKRDPAPEARGRDRQVEPNGELANGRRQQRVGVEGCDHDGNRHRCRQCGGGHRREAGKRLAEARFHRRFEDEASPERTPRHATTAASARPKRVARAAPLRS